MKLATFNKLDERAMREQLMHCCHCHDWASRVSAHAPFASTAALMARCDSEWGQASEAEILEAFSGHPQIGDLTALRNKYAATAGAEQGQVAAAGDTVLLALRDRNQAYLEKFGFIFIVCASGKSADEMLALLESRIGNSRAEELSNGAQEQGKIMKLRLEKLFEDE